MFDLLIVNGTVIDGTGKERFRKDIGITKNKITAIDDLKNAESKFVIDASNQIVSPGFVDIHTHTECSVFLDNRNESQIRQGVTTELGGLCGFSLAPCTNKTRKAVQGVCPLPIPGSWQSFEEYLSAMAHASPSTNIAQLVGHGSLRILTMGDKLVRQATDAEVKQMATLLEQCLEQGAFGFSSGLEYHPGKEATVSEIEALCRILPKYNVMHASHVRNRDKYALTAFTEVIESARNTQAKLQISHINPKYGRRPNTVKNTLALIQRMREEGAKIGFDVMPTKWNFTMGNAHLPSWAHALSKKELSDLLRTKEGRQKLSQNPTPIWPLFTDQKWDRVYHFTGNKTTEHIGKSILEIADELGTDGWSAFFHLLLQEIEDPGAFFVAGDSFFREDIIELLQDEYCSVCSDSIGTALNGPFEKMCMGANSYVWCVEFIKDYLLDGKILSLEEGIRRITSLPATQIGIKDRGLIKEQYFADLVIFNPNQLSANFSIKQPKRHPQGIGSVIVNGSIALHEGVRSETHTGVVLRNT